MPGPPTETEALIAIRLAKEPLIRDRNATMAIVDQCRNEPSARNLATLAWNYIGDVVAEGAPNYELPDPATEQSLSLLRDGIFDHFGCSAPEILFEILAIHDGILPDYCSALYSATQILERLTWLEKIDATLLPISGDLAGNHAAVRVAPAAGDHGVVYAFWHEDFARDGTTMLATSIAGYLMLARQDVVDSIVDMYHGPSPFE